MILDREYDQLGESIYICYFVDMKTITVAQLRQNPTAALAEVERGETYRVTRYRQEVARIVPPAQRKRVTPEELAAVLRATPVDTGWAGEVAVARADADGEGNVWDQA